jgi:hypothetical protein
MEHLHGEDPPWPSHVFVMVQESKHKQLPQTRRLRAFTRGLPTLGISYALQEKKQQCQEISHYPLPSFGVVRVAFTTNVHNRIRNKLWAKQRV